MPRLTISRKARESVKLGTDTVITVSKIRGSRVFLTFDAPAHIEIQRDDAKRGIATPTVRNRA